MAQVGKSGSASNQNGNINRKNIKKASLDQSSVAYERIDELGSDSDSTEAESSNSSSASSLSSSRSSTPSSLRSSLSSTPEVGDGKFVSIAKQEGKLGLSSSVGSASDLETAIKTKYKNKIDRYADIRSGETGLEDSDEFVHNNKEFIDAVKTAMNSTQSTVSRIISDYLPKIDTDNEG
ncbi:hypothetical protein DID75_05895, partial [Candidatus Marinamargulisbacteria bacterium SCGC AG-410-N11]